MKVTPEVISNPQGWQQYQLWRYSVLHLRWRLVRVDHYSETTKHARPGDRIVLMKPAKFADVGAAPNPHILPLEWRHV